MCGKVSSAYGWREVESYRGLLREGATEKGYKNQSYPKSGMIRKATGYQLKKKLRKLRLN